MTTPLKPPVFVGVDVGRTRDNAALCALTIDTGTRPLGHRPRYAVIHAEALPLGTSYEDIATHTGNVLATYTQAGHTALCALDATGVGAPVLERARQHCPPGADIIGITITASKNKIGGHWPDLTVGRPLLLAGVTVALEAHALRILPGLPAGPAIAAELRTHTQGNHLGDSAFALLLATFAADHVADSRHRIATIR